ncbi:MAG: homocysteine S-methyltransferase family protein, partial [Deltaproteobacteria bacterium]|nr:homocysteine S-methyltransferase family protein [Candidatus Tharpella aukensis]
SWGTWQDKIIVGGLMSCKNDCYLPEEGLSSVEAEAFHAWQSRHLSAAGVDFLVAQTLPALPEAVGLAQAMAATSTPYVISFVINREGRLLDGHSLAEAIAVVDAELEKPPLGYMVNCAYPSYLKAEREPDAVLSRLIGFQANASSLDHDQLNEAEKMQVDEVSDWGRRMVALNRNFGLPILGGCCGTGVEHLNYLINHLA